MAHPTKSITTISLSTVDKISMACDIGGQGKTLLLFIHGWTCRRAYWQPQLKHFAPLWRVAAPDLPGHGDTGSNGRNNWTVAAFGKDIAECARQLEAEKVILIGHSMGGAVALEAARILKATTTAVILVDTFVIDYGGIDTQTAQQIAAPFESDFNAAIAQLVEQTSTDATSDSLKKQLVSDMSSADPSWALPVWHDLLSWNPQTAFDELTIPVYAINGSLIPESARARCAPYVRETIISGAGHFLQMENPEKFNQVLEKTLNQIL
jgi:pimeloyl-ACP methyl ester carboxylesterase